MTVKPANCPHRLVYTVLLFIIGVTLATFLVVAGETAADNRKTDTSQINRKTIVATHVIAGIPACVRA